MKSHSLTSVKWLLLLNFSFCHQNLKYLFEWRIQIRSAIENEGCYALLGE